MNANTTSKHEELRWRPQGLRCTGVQKEGAPTGKPIPKSLSYLMDVWIGLAFIVAMAVCVGVEYVRYPDISLNELLLHHLLELFLFGFVLWGISWIVLRAVLVAPIQKIFLHLYGVGGGDQSPLVVNTRVREIREIVDAVNIMLWRMKQQANLKALDPARDEVVQIREKRGHFEMEQTNE